MTPKVECLDAVCCCLWYSCGRASIQRSTMRTVGKTGNNRRGRRRPLKWQRCERTNAHTRHSRWREKDVRTIVRGEEGSDDAFSNECVNNSQRQRRVPREVMSSQSRVSCFRGFHRRVLDELRHRLHVLSLRAFVRSFVCSASHRKRCCFVSVAVLFLFECFVKTFPGIIAVGIDRPPLHLFGGSQQQKFRILFKEIRNTGRTPTLSRCPLRRWA